MLDETDLAGNTQEEYIYFGGQRIARRTVDSNGATVALHYYFSDHLGSHGVVENSNGTACEQDIDYYPYGGVQNDHCATQVAQGYKFTGKERDTESGLDNFKARYFGSSLGRFQSPDPLHIEMHRLFDPQRLNLYAYARNNPLKYIDPTGLEVTCTGTRCDDYVKALQKLAGDRFKVTMDKNGKIGAEDVDKKNLSKSDKALLKAFDDTTHNVTINAIGGAKDSSVFFGASHGSSHTIAFDQTALLDAPKNAGGATSAQVAGHETLESYAESKGESLQDAHGYANGFFPGFDKPFYAFPGDSTATSLLSVDMYEPVHGGVTENIEFKFDTPIPIESISSATKQSGYPVDVSRVQ